MGTPGPHVAVAARVVRARHAQLQPAEVAGALRPGPFQVASIARDGLQVVTYSPYDPVDLPGAVVELLARFDGRPTGEVLAALHAEGIEIEPGLLGMLVDHELLVPSTHAGWPRYCSGFP